MLNREALRSRLRCEKYASNIRAAPMDNRPNRLSSMYLRYFSSLSSSHGSKIGLLLKSGWLWVSQNLVIPGSFCSIPDTTLFTALSFISDFPSFMALFALSRNGSSSAIHRWNVERAIPSLAHTADIFGIFSSSARASALCFSIRLPVVLSSTNSFAIALLDFDRLLSAPLLPSVADYFGVNGRLLHEITSSTHHIRGNEGTSTTSKWLHH